MKNLILSVAFFLFGGLISIYAVPAYPYLITKVQPDGTTISFYLKGSCGEFAYATSEDGYLLKENADGVFEYAVLDDDNFIAPTGIKAYNQLERSVQEKLFVTTLTPAVKLDDDIHAAVHAAHSHAMAKAPNFNVTSGYPLTGSPKSLVILVSFSDNDFTVINPADQFQRLVSEDGYSDNGATSSCREYFRTSSNNVFDPDFVVVGPYKLDKTIAYYGAPKGSNNDSDSKQMVLDACLKAAADGVDFSVYDTDNDGFVDNVFVFYAGYNEAEGGSANTIWPHRSSVSSTIEFSGKRLNNYSCTSELRGASGSAMCGIGTFCHEFGHVLGLPDFYDTGYSGHATLKTWDIMDQGPYNNNGRTPPVYSSHERFYLGWLTPTDLAPGMHTLESLESSNKAFIVRRDNVDLTSGYHSRAREYFMIENRQQEGLDSYVPGEGMLITHIVYSPSTWSSNTPNNDPENMGATIYCASGTTNSPSLNTYPGSKGVTDCQITFKDGTNLADPITNIKEENGVISFLYADGPSVVTKSPIEEMIMYQGEEPMVQLIEFHGSQFSDVVTLRLDNGRFFKIREYSADGTNDYGKTLTVTPDAADSTFTMLVELQFDPGTYISNDTYIMDEINATSTTIAADGSELNINIPFKLYAKSLRPVTVVSPVAYDPTSVTPWAFYANWSSVDDATAYYLSVFSIEDVDYAMTEEFSSFDTEFSNGWTSSFTKTSTIYKGSSPQAAYFLEPTDTIWTKEYFMDVKSISFWIHSANTSGQFFIDAYVDNAWTNIYNQEIDVTVRNKTVNVDLADISTRKFRIYYNNSSAGKGLAFDDFVANFPEKINYVLDDYEVFALEVDTMSVAVAGMTSGTEYIYNVKATDKDDAGKYNNVTEPSNDIHVLMPYGEEADAKKMSISYDESSNTYYAYVEKYDKDYSIYVYSMEGVLMAVVPSQIDKKIAVPTLPSNNVYILKYSSDAGIKRADVVGKFFYK